MTILEAYDRWRKLNVSQIRSIGMETLDELREEYLELQRKQMEYGQDNEGNIIGHYTSKAYGEMKFHMNPKADGYVDLKLTGDFQEELTLRIINKNRFEVYSQDWKNKLLVEKYGLSIFLLNPKFLALFQAKFKPKFNLKIKEFLRAA